MRENEMSNAAPARLLAALSVAVFLSSGCAAQSNGFTQAFTSLLPAKKSSSQTTADEDPALKNPAMATAQAPENFQVKFETTKGDIVVEVNRKWSPNGADRFYNLVKIGFFKDIAIFRAVDGFMFQFGIHGDPAVSGPWSNANIKDDPMSGISNTPGRLCFAKTGAPNSRSTQMFVNLGNNSFLDGQGFTPFGEVIKGMEVVRKINTEYGENRPQDDVQGNLKKSGNAFILKKFPNVDLIKSVKFMENN
jgi:peptidyl-prolyl cis-trans isomerase A (cyclophilin A)